MTYNIIDHGEWERYTPTEEEIPKNVPRWAQHARRKTDLVDWYVYIYPDVDPPPPFKMDMDSLSKSTKHTLTHRAAPIVVPLNFVEGTIKCAAYWNDGFNSYIVGPVTSDVTTIFPATQIVFEITDYTGTAKEAFAEFNGKAYDRATGAFTEPVPVEPPTKSPQAVKFDELFARIEKLETEIAALKR